MLQSMGSQKVRRDSATEQQVAPGESPSPFVALCGKPVSKYRCLVLLLRDSAFLGPEQGRMLLRKLSSGTGNSLPSASLPFPGLHWQPMKMASAAWLESW